MFDPAVQMFATSAAGLLALFSLPSLAGLCLSGEQQGAGASGYIQAFGFGKGSCPPPPVSLEVQRDDRSFLRSYLVMKKQKTFS